MSKIYGLAFNVNPAVYPSLAPTFITFQNLVTGSNETPPGITQLAATGLYFFSYGATQATYFLVDGITISVANDRYLSGILDPIQAVDNQLTAASVSLLAIGASNIALGTTNVALGTTNVALGTTSVALGTTNVAIGTTLTGMGVTTLGYATSIYAQSATILGYGISIYALAQSIYTEGLSGAAVNITLMGLIGNNSSSFGDISTDPDTVFGYLKRMQEYNEGDQNFNKTSGVWTIQARNTTLLATRQLGNTSTEVTRS